jgi:hypothetical protein
MMMGLFLGLAVWTPSLAAATQSIPPRVFNVRDFGAKGDGRTDDTAAIQAAVNAFTRDYGSSGLRVRRFAQSFGGTGAHAHSEVVFPPGTYRISRPIVFQQCAAARGIGEAVVEQADASREIFYFHGNSQAHIEGLRFKGGSTQLRFWTSNIDSAQIIVENCVFTDSAAYAVQCLSFTQKRLTGADWTNSRPWAPYTLTWEGPKPILTPTNADNIGYWNNSTVMTIQDCRFDQCMRAVASDCDGFSMRDCRITLPPQADGPIFKFPFGGESHLYNIQAQADPAPGKHPYWIQDGGILSVRDSDFLVAGKTGMGFIRADKEAMTTWEWFAVILENCRLTTAGGPDNAIIWLQKGIQPPIVSLTNVTETSGKSVNVFAWEDPAALADLKHFHTTAGGVAHLKDEYKIQFSGNSSNIDLNLPDNFKPFRADPIPDTIIKKTDVPRLPWKFQDLSRETTSTLYAADYLPADSDAHADMTGPIQKIFDAAAREGTCLVVFPGRIYEISDTVRLPSNLVVRGAGQTIFRQTKPDRPAFSIADAASVGFQNCQWVGGDCGVRIRTKADAKARIAFENCRLWDATVGIECLAGDGKMDAANQTELIFARGLFGCKQECITNASRSQLEDIWISSDPRLNDQAVFENRGGAMRVEAMLAVPKLWAGKRGKIPDQIKDWPDSRQTRWYDNWGQLYVLDSRFGGESGGMCNVYNRSPRGTVYIDGGITKFYNSLTRNCILYLEQDPAAAVLRNISAGASNVDGSSHVKRPAGRAGKANLFESAVMGLESKD